MNHIHKILNEIEENAQNALEVRVKNDEHDYMIEAEQACLDTITIIRQELLKGVQQS